MEGGIVLSATGYIQVHAYTSRARLPLQNVAVVVAMPDGTAIAMRLTDRSGMIPFVEIPVPDRTDSQSPGNARPFTTVNLYAWLAGYEQEEFEGVQVFADTITDQHMEMVPLAELPSSWDRTEIFTTPTQNL